MCLNLSQNPSLESKEPKDIEWEDWYSLKVECVILICTWGKWVPITKDCVIEKVSELCITKTTPSQFGFTTVYWGWHSGWCRVNNYPFCGLHLYLYNKISIFYSLYYYEKLLVVLSSTMDCILPIWRKFRKSQNRCTKWKFIGINNTLLGDLSCPTNDWQIDHSHTLCPRLSQLTSSYYVNDGRTVNIVT